MTRLAAAGLLAMLALPCAAAPPPGLADCRLDGREHGAWCGSVRRPLAPGQPQGTAIDIHFAVLPALARNRKADPVFFFAGGPGQSAIEHAATAGALLARFGNRRDIVLVDQRGTGRSAPLRCDDGAARPARPLRDSADPLAHAAAMRRCRDQLQALPHGDLRWYTTAIASLDVDAVRTHLGAARINLVGISYGTRAALDYLRQFPNAVRRVVLDGVAPPDMALPQASTADTQAAFDALLAACEADRGCAGRYPGLRAQWQALRRSLPRSITVRHPVTQAPETLTLSAEMLQALLRVPLYRPALAAALPHAVAEAAAGRFESLFGAATALDSGHAPALAEGMHFSVVCSEDMPRVTASEAAAAYGRVCADWPRGAVPAAFYTVPPSPVPVLLLSGGLDPATPPRHAARVAAALGAMARAVVVANGGHGQLTLPCLRDVVFRFIDAAGDAEALAVDAGCAAAVPRPPAFVPTLVPGATAVIEVHALAKSFASGRGRAARRVDALRSVDFKAADGRITGLLGPNGAGKTTTLRIVAALLVPDAGRVAVDGIDIARQPTAALARLGVLSDARGLYPRLTARENIVYYGRLHGMSAAAAGARAEELAAMLDMRALLDRRTEGTSQGEKMKTALARALVHDPPNIVLDEPTNGLDVLATRALRDALRRLRDDRGKCIVFSSHVMQEVEKLCDHVVVVAHGRTVAAGTVAELGERSGERDFEDAFVRLAFDGGGGAPAP